MKPERHIFETEFGRVFEAPIGTSRECFLIDPGGQIPIPRLAQDLRRDHGSEVALGENVELGLTYIVSMRLDGKFTDNQVRKIVGVYKGMIRALPASHEDEETGQVIKGPWPQS